MSLGNCSFWTEVTGKSFNNERLALRVFPQFSFFDARGWPMEAGVLAPQGRGWLIKEALDSALGGSFKLGSWTLASVSLDITPVVSFAVVVVLSSHEEKDPQEVREIVLDLFSFLNSQAQALALSCDLVSVAKQSEFLTSSNGWYSEKKRDPTPIEINLEHMDRLGSIIKERRDFLHVSLDDVAKKSGIARRTILRLEGGSEGVSIGNVLRVAKSLGLHLKASPE